MADARKRAQKKPESADVAPPSPPVEAVEQPPPASLAEETSWVARDEAFVFPVDDAEPAPPATGKLTLPPSGLAADILAAVEDAAPRPARLSLPASGLAADILALTADVAMISDSPAPEPAVTPAPAAADASARTHNISFFAAPAREERKSVEATEHLATFFLADEEYGIDVRLVQEIIRVTDITQVPRAPEFIKGVINLRGRIIPVIDLRRKLSLGAVDDATRQARIVVVKVRERLIGLLVDGASQVLKVPVSCVEPPPEEVIEIDANYIRGVAKLEKRLIILVDLHKILALELRAGSQSGSQSGERPA